MAISASEQSPAELAIGGMSCAACAARIEKRLNQLDGVIATVNYATERAYVTATGGRDLSELVTAIEAAGYTAAVPSPASPGTGAFPRRADAFRLRALVCAPLALTVIVLAMVPSVQFAGWQWVSLVLAGAVAGWGAWPLHRAAWASLEHATATMDTLVSLGITASFTWSIYAMLFGGAGMIGMRMPFELAFGPVGQHTLYLDVAAGVTVTVLTGRYLEARAKDRAGSALFALAELGAKTVAVLRDGVEQRVSADSLVPGDRFVVRPGEKIATDGIVLEGHSAVDASLLTGEPVPVETAPGDEVTGGTLNRGGRLLVQASRVGSQTTLGQIISLVTAAQTGKAAAQRLADSLAAVFVPCVVSLAVVALGFWLGVGLPSQDAWGAGFAVLVVACPCALGLATPTALLAGTGRGAQLGILVKNMQALESARRIDTVVFDKTGTLTIGAMTVLQVIPAAGQDETELLRLAGAVEDCSEHPIGQAIARDATRLGPLPAVTGFTSVAGLGVLGQAGGYTVACGSLQFLADHGMEVPAELVAAVGQAGVAGQGMGSSSAASGGNAASAGSNTTAVLTGWDGRARGAFIIADALRPTAPDAVRLVARLGARVLMVTGDNAAAAGTVAAQAGIAAEDVYTGRRPAGKVELVRELQGAGRRVAVVGDGVNDAAALAQADLGIAISTGADAAIGAADLTLVTGDLRTIAEAIGLARATLRTIHRNLGWAFGYNLIAIPLAALGYLNPLFAGIAMSASSLIVVANSLRLRGYSPRSRQSRGPDHTGAGSPKTRPVQEAAV
jgi:P-type Cu+ transporter